MILLIPLLSGKTWFKKFLDNFIYVIINNFCYPYLNASHDFLSVFRRHKYNCYPSLNFPNIRYFEIIYYIIPRWCIFVKVFFDWYCFIYITLSFVFNTIVVTKITIPYWFAIKFPSFSNWKRFWISLIILSFSFFSLKIFFINLKRSHKSLIINYFYL